jgi:hypothetical protein
LFTLNLNGKGMKHILILITFLGLGLLQAQDMGSKRKILPGKLWNDSRGAPINAHGGGVLYHNGVYYWYGTHKIQGLSEAKHADGGIHCYASNDLVKWSDMGRVLYLGNSDDHHDLQSESNFDRPKIVYNAKTGNFVAFFKLYLKGFGVETGFVGVATSKSPTGPFVYSHKFLGGNSQNGSGDFAIHQEENGDLFHLTVRKPDKAFVVGKMNADYLMPEGKYQVCAGILEKTEAPAIVKRNGVYHLIASGSTGWDPNPARYYTSNSLAGPWKYHGNPCSGINPNNGLGLEKTFGGQSTFILKVQGKDDAYIAMFDINKPDHPYESMHIWLPITIKDNRFSIQWIDAFGLDMFKAQAASTFDLVVYGATSAGISTAIQGSRMGKKVMLIEPSGRVGGLTTGGLGQTDIGNKQAIGGISREFYQNIKRFYLQPENWKWQSRESYRDGGQTRTSTNEDAMWTFEPSAALKVFEAMLSKEKNITLAYHQRLNRQNGVVMLGKTIQSIQMESGEVYIGKMFIDCTYEGDLMAAAGVSYTVGRESNSQYGESLNGVQAGKTGLTLRNNISRNAYYHNFIEGVDPYVIKGSPQSGLLPFIGSGKPDVDGTGDHKIQAYCFRMTLTDHVDNRIPFSKPLGYNEMDYELLFRNYEARVVAVNKMYDYGDPLVPWINSDMPNRKTDTNNQKGFSTDFIGQNYAYPDATYQERDMIIQRHKHYQQGLMWTLAYHPRIPEEVRAVVSKWGLCKDEFENGNGWSGQLYVREARRMVSDHVMTQKNCEKLEVVNDAVGLGAYGMDSHHIQRYVDANGYVKNEGNVEAGVASPFPVSYRSIVPKKSEVQNLFVPVCLSASHIAFGSIRMEPVFMVLGQSSAIAACMAIDKKMKAQDIEYKALKPLLLEFGQRLE